MKWLKMISGYTDYNGICFMAHSSQDTFLCNDEDAESFLRGGSAVEVDPPEKPPEISTESVETIKSKISEMEKDLSDTQKLLEKTLTNSDGDFRKTLSEVEKFENRRNALNKLMQKQREFLVVAKEKEQRTRDQIIAESWKNKAGTFAREGSGVLDEVSKHLTAALEAMERWMKLYQKIDSEFVSDGGKPGLCPLLSSLHVRNYAELNINASELIDYINLVKSDVSKKASQCPHAILEMLNSRYYKSESELWREVRAYEKQEAAKPENLFSHNTSYVPPLPPDTRREMMTSESIARGIRAARHPNASILDALEAQAAGNPGLVDEQAFAEEPRVTQAKQQTRPRTEPLRGKKEEDEEDMFPRPKQEDVVVKMLA